MPPSSKITRKIKPCWSSRKLAMAIIAVVVAIIAVVVALTAIVAIITSTIIIMGLGLSPGALGLRLPIIVITMRRALGVGLPEIRSQARFRRQLLSLLLSLRQLLKWFGNLVQMDRVCSALMPPLDAIA